MHLPRFHLILFCCSLCNGDPWLVFPEDYVVPGGIEQAIEQQLSEILGQHNYRAIRSTLGQRKVQWWNIEADRSQVSRIRGIAGVRITRTEETD